MPQAVNCMPILFGDDTCLIFTDPNLAFLTTIMNKEFQNLSISFDSNKLTVNPSKSNFLSISPKLNEPFPQINVFLNNIFSLFKKGFSIELDVSIHACLFVNLATVRFSFIFPLVFPLE